MTSHTFLIKPGRWIARGQYIDENGKQIAAKGESVIRHEKETWINDGFMRLLQSTPVEFKNRYEIEPVNGRPYTTYISENPALGTLFGQIIFVDDRMVQNYISEDRQINGQEILTKISDDEYKSTGFAFRKNQRLSSWTVTLKRT